MKRFVVAATVALLSSCATTQTAPPMTKDQIDSSFLQAARQRAVFELPCATTDITTVFLGDRTSAGPHTTDRVIGVTGCAQRAVYVSRCTMTPGEGRGVVVAARCSALLNSSDHRPATGP